MTVDANTDFSDIPGTYVMTPEHSRVGYSLNMFCMSLNKEENRDEFRADEAKYLDKFSKLTSEQRAAILARDFLAMLRLGGNIYYTFKIAIFDKMTMQGCGAAMSGGTLTEQEFIQMMVNGGRPLEGNQSKQENSHNISR